MDTNKSSLPPYENGYGHSGPSSVPSVRNFRQLLVTLVKHASQERAYTSILSDASPQTFDNPDTDPTTTTAHADNGLSLIQIHPTHQLVQLEPRAHDVSSFNVNADFLSLFGDARNRWIDYSHQVTAPPSPLRVARLIMSPHLCTLYLAKLHPTPSLTCTLSPAALSQNNDLMHLIIVQGQAAAESRRFMAVETFHEAASTLFNELANGCSVVFVGLMFKSEFVARMTQGTAYRICRGVDELRHWQGHAVGSVRAVTPVGAGAGAGSKEKEGKKGKDKEESKKVLGIIC